MQVERIDEPVKVRADFEGGEIRPLRVRRDERAHRVTGLHASWVDRSGRFPRHGFSVGLDTGDVWELVLRTRDMTWWVESVTMDG